MKKLLYIGLLAYVFWMDEDQKKPIFEAVAKLLDRLPRSSDVRS